MFLTEDVSSLIRGSNPFIHPTFQYFVTAANEESASSLREMCRKLKGKRPHRNGAFDILLFRYLSCSPSI